MRKIILTAGTLLLAGCSSVGTRKVMPLDRFQRIFVERRLNDNQGLDAIFVAELLVFLNTGPLNTVLVGSTPPSVRELGVGLHVLCIHLLGDAFSPTVLGALDEVRSRTMPTNPHGSVR